MYKRIYKQAFILGFSNILVKVLGLIFIFPFARMVGKEGVSLYTYAYVPYVFLTDLTTLGLVPGTSKYVSKLMANEENGKASYLLKKVTIFTLIIGLLSFIILNIFAIPYAKMQFGSKVSNINDIIMAIRVVSLSLLITPTLSFFRGFLQGCLRIVPSSISIIIEQFIRVTIILATTYYIIKVKQADYKYAVFAAVGAAFVGSLVSSIFLYFITRRYRKSESEKFEFKSKLIKICINIGITTIFLTVYQTIDSLTFLKYSRSDMVLDYYRSFAFESARLIIIPIILAQSLASAVLPNLAKANEINNEGETRQGIEKVITLSLLLLIPMVFIFFIFADPIYHFFYAGDGIGPKVLGFSSMLIFSYGFNKIMIGILQGINKGRVLMFSTFITFAIKFLGNIILIKALDYKGMILSSMLSSMFSIIVCIYILNKNKMISISKLVVKVSTHIIICLLASVMVYLVQSKVKIAMYNYKTYFLNLIIFVPIFYAVYLLSVMILRKLNKRNIANS